MTNADNSMIYGEAVISATFFEGHVAAAQIEAILFRHLWMILVPAEYLIAG